MIKILKQIYRKDQVVLNIISFITLIKVLLDLKVKLHNSSSKTLSLLKYYFKLVKVKLEVSLSSTLSKFKFYFSIRSTCYYNVVENKPINVVTNKPINVYRRKPINVYN